MIEKLPDISPKRNSMKVPQISADA